jgi:hypothetical protein
MTYKAYMRNIEAKTGKNPQDFWILSNKLGLVKEEKIAVTRSKLLEWLKSDIGLGHVHANTVILYLRLRTNDPKLSDKMKKWAFSTGYQDSV